LFNSLDPAQDGDSDDSLYLKPNKKKKTDLTDFFAKVPDPSNVDKKPTARKASGSAKPAPKKPAKKVSDDDDDDAGGEKPSPVVARAPPRRAAQAAAKKYVEVVSDDSEDEGNISTFMDDD
jgi:DNA topoisomerase II